MNEQISDYLGGIPTEQALSGTNALDTMNGLEIARLMNAADAEVHAAVRDALAPIADAIEQIAERMRRGGRLYYIGAGTSGRLGVLDASECPPTFGVSPDVVKGIIAGGDRALRQAVEAAEDDIEMGKRDIQKARVNGQDAVVAISASGYAPYCRAALDAARELGALAIGLSCNRNTPLSKHADIAIEVATGPEILMGSTRLKAGTATKMVLNMLSTGAMIRTGRVFKNLMVDMAATNFKLRARAVRLVCQATGVSGGEAESLLAQSGGQVKVAILMHLGGVAKGKAEWALEQSGGSIAGARDLLSRHEAENIAFGTK